MNNSVLISHILIALMSIGLATPRAWADEACPEIQGTYLCQAPGLTPYYVDLLQYHTPRKNCSGGYCFDVFLIYYKANSKGPKSSASGGQDRMSSLTLVTNPEVSKDFTYWTLPIKSVSDGKDSIEQERARWQMHSRASCFVGVQGKSKHSDGSKRIDLAGQKILRVEMEAANFKYKEIRYIAHDPHQVNQIVVAAKEVERKDANTAYGAQSSSSIEVCDRVSASDPNVDFAKKKNGDWKAFSSSIKLFGKNSRGAPGRPEDQIPVRVSIESQYRPKGNLVEIKMVDAQGKPLPKNFDLPGRTSKEEFGQFLKNQGFVLVE